MTDRTASAHSLFLVLVSSLSMWLSGSANAQSKGDVFFGYSFTSSGLRVSVPGGSHSEVTAGRASLNGWDASASLKILPFIRGVVDVGAGYGNLPVDFSAFGFPTQRISIRTNLHTYLLGPRAAISARKMTLFGHALFGVAHQNLGTNPTLNVGTRDSAFAFALGGGLDTPLVSRLAFRVGGDYLRTTLFHATQHNPRFITGLVVKF